MVWLQQYNGRAFSARGGPLRAVPTPRADSSEADDTLLHIMPSASPLLNQFPSAVSDPECLYRYPLPTADPVCPTHPHSLSTSSSSAGLKLPADYDPFKFLSAMTEQCLTGNFLAQEHAQALPQTCTSVASASHFLLSPSVPQTPTSTDLTSSLVSSSSPHQYYTSSAAYCMYGEGGVEKREEFCCTPGLEVDIYHQQQQHHHQQTTTTPCPNAAEGREEREKVEAASKNVFCSTEELMESADSEGLLSWTRQHPEHWSHSEVLDWLFYVAQERGLAMQDFRGEAFQSITGRQLSHMTRDDFSRLEPQYGALLYEMFKSLLCGVTFSKPANDNAQPPNSSSQPLCAELSPYSAVSCDSSRDSPAPPTYQLFQAPSKTCSDVVAPAEVYWQPEPMEWKIERQEPQQSHVLDIDSYDFDLSDASPSFAQQPESGGPDHDVFIAAYPSSTPVRTSCFFPPYPYPHPHALPRRRPGRPRVKSLPEDDDRLKDKKVKNQHLWEFIYDTLLNPLYNPQYLRWENQREGVFRFVQSEAVAQLWGSRKNNENMTYEKLSRAMRHYYKRGILERVEGRRLVYKFSHKAMERVRDKRHNSV